MEGEGGGEEGEEEGEAEEEDGSGGATVKRDVDRNSLFEPSRA